MKAKNVCILLLIFLVITCTNSNLERYGTDNYYVGQHMSDIPECTNLKPEQIGGSNYYYCELHSSGETIGAQNIDRLLLRFDDRKRIEQINVGIYGEEKILDLLEKRFGDFSKVINSTNDYYLSKDSIMISYKTMYSDPGDLTVTNNKQSDNIKYHMVTIEYI